MKTLVTVYADKPDFNYSNALILYSITNVARHYGFKTIIVSEDNIPVFTSDRVKVTSYINSIPNIIVEKWIRSMNISITLSELLHEIDLNEILCYGVPCLLAITPIRKIADIRVVYTPSIADILALKNDDRLVSETFTELLRHVLKYVDLIFDYELGIKQIIGYEELVSMSLINDPKALEDFILREAGEK